MSDLQEMLEVFPAYMDLDLRDSIDDNLQDQSNVVWPVDILFVPEQSIALVR